MSKKALLILEDGSEYEGFVFGYPRSTSGEVVFSTGMVGYTESLTDPSYYGQILISTYPIIGNYGVTDSKLVKSYNPFESTKIQAKAFIIADYSPMFDHWNALQSLSDWMNKEKIPGIYGIDTRALTKHLREKGTMLGKIIVNDQDVDYYDPNTENLMDLVSIKEPQEYGQGSKTIGLLDCGCKTSILTNLSQRSVKVIRLPWNWDVSNEKFDGIVISSGPGDPQTCTDIISHVTKVLQKETPLMGICLGHQVIALASGAKTYKLKYGHRSQNQPVIQHDSKHCYVTSQNHGFAVNNDSLSDDWLPFFNNLNDKTNEGIIHKSGRAFSVQFHPEASPGPYDTTHLFDKFLGLLK
ncbi:MAG: glutamine-hydrolyzing carbamoyl-phosphate synthase small subunit [Calditrichae bacterium]|nr:glutamine-hydrolyzing carbamoyl-phosphate synthase small subunit [Calditrichia bacterium]